jgi:hypothetical protein
VRGASSRPAVFQLTLCVEAEEIGRGRSRWARPAIADFGRQAVAGRISGNFLGQAGEGPAPENGGIWANGEASSSPPESARQTGEARKFRAVPATATLIGIKGPQPVRCGRAGAGRNPRDHHPARIIPGDLYAWLTTLGAASPPANKIDVFSCAEEAPGAIARKATKRKTGGRPALDHAEHSVRHHVRAAKPGRRRGSDDLEAMEPRPRAQPGTGDTNVEHAPGVVVRPVTDAACAPERTAASIPPPCLSGSP